LVGPAIRGHGREHHARPRGTVADTVGTPTAAPRAGGFGGGPGDRGGVPGHPPAATATDSDRRGTVCRNRWWSDEM